MIATPRPLTHEDVQDLPDDSTRHEIINGELIVTPAPTGNHQRVVGSLYSLLRGHARARALGEAMVAPFDVRLSLFDTVEPDINFVGAGQRRIRGNLNFIDEAPDLVVEVISPSSRRIDRVQTMALYARSGVPEYWIADPQQRSLVVHAHTEDRYVPIAADRYGQVVSRVVPGLRIDPAEIFADMD